MEKDPMKKIKEIMVGKFIKGKTYVFIDAANILYSQQTLRWRIDYKKLKQYFEKECDLGKIYFYTGKVGKLERQLKFIKRLENLGFQVTAKEVKLIKIDGGKNLAKGNLDVELALDAYRLRKKYDTALLFSGDSDFAYLLDLLKKEDKNTIVFSTRGHISKELLDRAKYIDLRKLKEIIEYGG